MPAAHALTTPPGQGDKQDLFVCFGKKISFFEDLYFDVLVFFGKEAKKMEHICPDLVLPEIEGHSFAEVIGEGRSDHCILSCLELLLYFPKMNSIYSTFA